ncbi:hypothetical protein [Ilyomonas limi]|uniref:hypothetical protein n=1 Tax=Ilyomonas limi TaxID=2575867 RepID=UPI001485959E|nr:hypothetical protein [Ilyomonas limi]
MQLTGEHWTHIALRRSEIADYYYDILNAIENHDIIYEGNSGAKIAMFPIFFDVLA